LAHSKGGGGNKEMDYEGGLDEDEIGCDVSASKQLEGGHSNASISDSEYGDSHDKPSVGNHATGANKSN
jgi:hypothetical protein